MTHFPLRKSALILGFTHASKVVENFVEQISAAFLSLNFEPHVIYVDQDIAAQIGDLNPNTVGMVLSIGPLPLQLKLNNQKIYEIFQCPFVLYSIDNVLYDFANHPMARVFFDDAVTHHNLHFAFSEKSYCDLYSKLWQTNGVNRPIHFLPMGGFFQGQSSRLPERRKAIAVVGNLGGLPVKGASVSGSLSEMVENNAPAAVSTTEKTALLERLVAKDFNGNVARCVLEACSIPLEYLMEPEYLSYMAAIDRNIRVRVRAETVSSLKGLPVDFYGTGWDELFGTEPSFNHRNQVSHYQIPELFQSYKCVLNFDPNFEHGVHDRVITALASGATVITNKNQYLTQIRDCDQAIFTYSLNETNIYDLAVNALETDTEPSCPKQIYKEHSWGSRIYDLLRDIAAAST